MRSAKKVHPLLILLITLMLAAIAWAVSELSGQANKSAADAGASSADMEMASLDIIKPSVKAPDCDWALEKRLREQLAGIDKAYQALVAQAKKEVAGAGEVSAGLRDQLLASAGQFRDVSEEYAKMWEAGKCVTRAKLAREAGLSRVASAEVIAYGADGKRADALKKQQDRLNDARRAYVQEASSNKELTPEDKAAVQKSVLPRAQQLVTDTAALIKQLTELLDQIKSQASAGGVTGALGSLGRGGDNSSPAAVAKDLLSPVSSLLSLAKGLAGNAQNLLKDVNTLIK